jgi:hypothetical protein
MRAIGIRGARASVDVSFAAAKMTSNMMRERSVPLKQTQRLLDASNNGAGRPYIALQQSTCRAVELARAFDHGATKLRDGRESGSPAYA